MLWKDIFSLFFLLMSFIMYMCENHWISREKNSENRTRHSSSWKDVYFLSFVFKFHYLQANCSWVVDDQIHCDTASVPIMALIVAYATWGYFGTCFLHLTPAHLSHTQVLQPLNIFLDNFLQIVTVCFSMAKQYFFRLDHSYIHSLWNPIHWILFVVGLLLIDFKRHILN